MLWKFIRIFTQAPIIDEHTVLKLGSGYYLVDEKLRRMVVGTNMTCAAAGILLGREFGTGFLPSTYLLTLLCNKAEFKVTLNEKGAWLFICARDIFSESIIEVTGKPSVRDLVLVMNAKQECLGIGSVEQKLQARGLVIKNVYDIGWFVRKKAKPIRID